MLIPYNSDAPLYHFPYATIGLIVVNVLLFFLWPPYNKEQELRDHFEREVALLDFENMTEEEREAAAEELLAALPRELLHPDWRMLHFGNGLWPWQWLSANFMHADFLHLFGNMIFLWGLGLVVEGKVGWWRFLLIYLAVGMIGYGLVQLVMLWASGGNALGASLPIYGVLVLALLWAPKNDLNCFLMAGMRPMLVDVPIMYFAGGYLALQVVFFFLSGMSMGSEALHLAGALVALPIGVYMLKKNLVDCEDWDVFSVWSGRNDLTREELRIIDEAQPEFIAKVTTKKEMSADQIQKILTEQQDPVLAWAAHQRMKHRFADWSLPEPLARAILRLFHEQGKKAESVPAMIEYLRSYPAERAIDVRLIFAHYMIQQDRPRQALRLLAPLERAALSDSQRAAREKLARAAERKKDDVEFEEPPEDW